MVTNVVKAQCVHAKGSGRVAACRTECIPSTRTRNPWFPRAWYLSVEDGVIDKSFFDLEASGSRHGKQHLVANHIHYFITRIDSFNIYLSSQYPRTKSISQPSSPKLRPRFRRRLATPHSRWPRHNLNHPKPQQANPHKPNHQAMSAVQIGCTMAPGLSPSSVPSPSLLHPAASACKP